MDILLDTHILLWFYSGDAQISTKVKNLIKDPSNVCFISIASLWGITIKYNLGKLELDDSLEELFNFVKRNQINVLSIELHHLLKITSLPNIHKDPFDRIIIAQGISENIRIATKDAVFSEYDVDVLW